MNLFVDTSVWSLVLRRDSPADSPEAARLRHALELEETVITTGLVVQELLQGITGPKMRLALQERFAALPFIMPEREDHIRAADLHSAARRKGIQIGTVDALLAALCVEHGLTMLTADHDFHHLRRVSELSVWSG